MGRVSHDLEEVQYITLLPHLDCHARYEKVDMYLLHMHFFLGLQPNLTCVTAVSCTGMEGEICTAIQQSAPHLDFGLPFSSGGGLGIWGDVCIFSFD